MRFVIFLCLVAQVFSLFCASDFENGCFCEPNNRGDDCICEGNCNGGNLSNYLIVAVTSSGILKAKQKLGTGSPLLTRFLETLGNRVSRKPRCP